MWTFLFDSDDSLVSRFNDWAEDLLEYIVLSAELQTIQTDFVTIQNIGK